MRKNRALWQWGLSVVFVVFGAWLWFHTPGQESNHRAAVITNHNPSITPLWVRADYYMYPSDHIRMVALGNKLFSIGSASNTQESKLIALDANTGDILWQYGDSKVSVLAVSDNKLFIGELGGGKVIALNPEAGAIEWSSNHIGNVTNLLFRDNILYADTVGENYYLFDADTGNILKTIPYTTGKASNPDIPIWSNHHMNLQFVRNIGFFQTPTDFPTSKGEIIATDVNGNQIWSSNSFYSATGIATSPLGIFVLDSDGKLLRFNPANGVKNEVIRFQPAPSLRNGYSFGYYVAADSNKQMLFVYLGDSTQLFAFQIQ